MLKKSGNSLKITILVRIYAKIMIVLLKKPVDLLVLKNLKKKFLLEMLQLLIASYQVENENEYNKINYFRRII